MEVVSTIYPSTDGSDVPLFLMPPDWAGGWRTTWQYQTDIIVSDQGSEQRRAVLYVPRRTFEFTILGSQESKLWLDQFFVRCMGRAAWMPDFQHFIRMTAPLDLEVVDHDEEGNPIWKSKLEVTYSHDQVVNSSTGVPYWIYPGLIVMLVDGYRCETRTVAGVSTGSIQFVERTDAIFPEGSKIYPMVPGWFKDSPDMARKSNRVTQPTITFIISPAYNPPMSPDVTVNYANGIEIWQKQPNWSDELAFSPTTPVDELDYGYGLINRVQKYDWQTRTISMSFVGRNELDGLSAIQFFMRQWGMQKAFYLVSQEDDIIPQALLGGGMSIIIPGQMFGITYKDSTVFKRIMLRMRDGRRLTFGVDFIEVLPDTDSSVIWLKDRLPTENLTDDYVAGISWVYYARFASDSLDVVWLTDRVCQFKLSFTVLENNEA